MTIVPGSGAYSTYSTTGTAADGLSEPSFYASFSFFLVAMAILCSVYCVASIRTNIALFLIFALLIPCCKLRKLSIELAKSDNLLRSRLPISFLLCRCSGFCRSCAQIPACRSRLALSDYLHRLVHANFDASLVGRLSSHTAPRRPVYHHPRSYRNQASH